MEVSHIPHTEKKKSLINNIEKIYIDKISK